MPLSSGLPEESEVELLARFELVAELFLFPEDLQPRTIANKSKATADALIDEDMAGWFPLVELIEREFFKCSLPDQDKHARDC